MATRADSTPAPSRRRRLPAKVRRRAAPCDSQLQSAQLAPNDRARIEGLIARLIALLDAHDALMADMEPDADCEPDAEEASEQPARHPTVSKVIRFPRLRRPRIDWSTPAQQEAAELAAPPVVSHRRGSKPGRAMSRPAPFRGDAPLNPPVGQVYRPGFLRRSLAYLANGERPPLSTFGGVPFVAKAHGNQWRTAVGSQHPETRHGGDRKSSGKVCHLNSFTDDTALRASLVACSIIFAACAGWAVVL